MENRIIERTIRIKASVNKVWRVFTDPDITQQMGGFYETDWKPGSSFQFKNTKGDSLTNGILLELQPEQLIKHSLLVPGSETVMAVLTYEFQAKDNDTLLTGKEVLMQPLEKTAFDEACAGWELALQSVKEAAEKI